MSTPIHIVNWPTVEGYYLVENHVDERLDGKPGNKVHRIVYVQERKEPGEWKNLWLSAGFYIHEDDYLETVQSYFGHMDQVRFALLDLDEMAKKAFGEPGYWGEGPPTPCAAPQEPILSEAERRVAKDRVSQARIQKRLAAKRGKP